MAEAVLNDPNGIKSPFEYALDLSSPANAHEHAQAQSGFPVNGIYGGHFVMKPPGALPYNVDEKSLNLSFSALEVGQTWSVHGKGRNRYGIFELNGKCTKKKDAAGAATTASGAKTTSSKTTTTSFHVTVFKKYTQMHTSTKKGGARKKSRGSKGGSSNKARPNSKPKPNQRRNGNTKQPRDGVPSVLSTVAAKGLPIRRQASQRQSRKPSRMRKEEEESKAEALSQHLNKCLANLKYVMTLKGSSFFNVPVDFEAYPKYLEYIDRPMDFGTIKDRLIAGYYTRKEDKSPEDLAKDRGNTSFHEHNAMKNPSVSPLGPNYGMEHEGMHNDVKLVCDNAMLFNKQGDYVYTCAKQTWDAWAKKYASTLRQMEKRRLALEEKKRKDEEARHEKERIRREQQAARERKKLEAQEKRRQREENRKRKRSEKSAAARAGKTSMRSHHSSGGGGGSSGQKRRKALTGRGNGMMMDANTNQDRHKINSLENEVAMLKAELLRMNKRQARQEATKRMNQYGSKSVNAAPHGHGASPHNMHRPPTHSPHSSHLDEFDTRGGTGMPGGMSSRGSPGGVRDEPAVSSWSFEDRKVLGDQIHQLPEQHLLKVVTIIYENGFPDGEEVEIDLEAVDDAKLRELKAYVDKARKNLVKSVHQASTGEEMHERLTKATHMRLEEIESELSAMSSSAIGPNASASNAGDVKPPLLKKEDNKTTTSTGVPTANTIVGHSQQSAGEAPASFKAEEEEALTHDPFADDAGLVSGADMERMGFSLKDEDSHPPPEMTSSASNPIPPVTASSSSSSSSNNATSEQDNRRMEIEEQRRRERESRQNMTRQVDMEAQSKAMNQFQSSFN